VETPQTIHYEYYIHNVVVTRNQVIEKPICLQSVHSVIPPGWRKNTHWQGTGLWYVFRSCTSLWWAGCARS